MRGSGVTYFLLQRQNLTTIITLLLFMGYFLTFGLLSPSSMSHQPNSVKFLQLYFLQPERHVARAFYTLQEMGHLFQRSPFTELKNEARRACPRHAASRQQSQN